MSQLKAGIVMSIILVDSITIKRMNHLPIEKGRKRNEVVCVCFIINDGRSFSNSWKTHYNYISIVMHACQRFIMLVMARCVTNEYLAMNTI